MRKFAWVGISVAVLWTVWAAQMPIITALGFCYDVARLGPWGDTFGALSSLFTACAFLGAVYAILLQKGQINQEKLDQEIINKQVREEEHRQRFEASFFELLKFLREARDHVRFVKISKQGRSKKSVTRREEVNGYEAFRRSWRHFYPFVRLTGYPYLDYEIGRLYDRHVHNRYESNFGPCYRLIYTILYRIKHDQVLSEVEKIRYGNLLRTQITSYELALVGLNGLSSVSKDFRHLLTEFHFLKYLPSGSSRRKLLEKYYHKQAFAPRDD